MPSSSERGQASVEWIAIVLVVAAALVAAVGGAVPGAEAIPRSVGATFERAFCLVSGGDCLSGAPRPCVARSDEHIRERRLSAAIARLGDGRRVLREELSDGSVAVTVEDSASAGAAVTAGVKATAGGRGVKASAELGGGLAGGTGRRFVVPDAAAADRLIALLDGERSGARAIVEGAGNGVPAPDEHWWAIGNGGEAKAELEALHLGGGRARAVARAIGSVRRRPRTGERTVVLRSDTAGLAELTVPLARLGMELLGDTAVEIGFDAQGRPASLTVRGSRGVHGEARLGPLGSGGGDLVEAEARLDLADPVARELVADLLGSPRHMLAAARALGERLVERGRIDVRLYETDRRSSVKGAAAAFGVQFGYEVEEIDRTARLVDAAGREPGMGWARRLDCVGVA